jgi:SEC-C motif
VSTNLGRNDLCYCGSGKKYKRCHLPIDQKARPAPVALMPKVATAPHPVLGLRAQDDRTPVPRSYKGLKDALKKLTGSGQLKRDPELRRIFKDNETLLTYLASQEEIESASAKLAPYEEEFGRLADDNEAFMRRTEQLFNEESFAPLRWTAAEIEKAFQEAGFPPSLGSDEEVHNSHFKALLFLASKERRNNLAMELLTRMPEYVAQGRFIDARLITFAAHATVEAKDEANPFLLCMFLFGLREWITQQQEKQLALLRSAGLNPKANMGPEEIEAWIAEQSADPGKAARLEQLLDAHPELRAQSIANLEAMRRNAVRLFDRPDSAPLLLQLKEMEPWLPFVTQKLQMMQEKYELSKTRTELSPAEQEEAFSNMFLPAMRELTQAIFTPERIRKLVADLKVYRRDLLAAGDQTAAFYVIGAIRYVEREDDPALNVFLLNLCVRSLPGFGSE